MTSRVLIFYFKGDSPLDWVFFKKYSLSLERCSCGQGWIVSCFLCPHVGFMRTWLVLFLLFLSSWRLHVDTVESFLAFLVLIKTSCGHGWIVSNFLCPHNKFLGSYYSIFDFLRQTIISYPSGVRHPLNICQINRINGTYFRLFL